MPIWPETADSNAPKKWLCVWHGGYYESERELGMCKDCQALVSVGFADSTHMLTLLRKQAERITALERLAAVLDNRTGSLMRYGDK